MDLHCLQWQGISMFSRLRVKRMNLIFADFIDVLWILLIKLDFISCISNLVMFTSKT